MDEEYVDRIVENLRDYGYHRNELFVSRRMAKEAANVIERLRARVTAFETVTGIKE